MTYSDLDQTESLLAYNLRRKSIMAALTSSARSWLGPMAAARRGMIGGRSLQTIADLPGIGREKAAATHLDTFSVSDCSHVGAIINRAIGILEAGGIRTVRAAAARVSIRLG